MHYCRTQYNENRASADQDDRLDVTLSPNQTYRTVINVKTSSNATVDIRQTRLVNNLEKLLDNQEGSFDLQDPEESGASIPAKDVASYTSSRSAYRARTLQQDFPTITPAMSASLFPLLDPLDLDISIAWSIPDRLRHGHVFQHALSVGPRFSIVEGLRAKVDAAIASGSKTTRTMYEETGRLRKLLLDSVLQGELAREDDPLIVRAYLVDAKAGTLSCDFQQGSVLFSAEHTMVAWLIPLRPSLIPVKMEIHNLSPLLSTRFILTLPSGSTSTSTTERTYTPSRHVGQLDHRGTLPPGQTVSIDTSIWVGEATLVELSWELRLETGEMVDGVWTVRKTWNREERGGVWKIEQSASTP